MIEAETDLQAYFRERLQAACGRRDLRPHPTTEFYVVNLLSRFATAAPDAADAPLVYRLAEAMDAPDPATRLRLFREMGDAALYACGFFADHLARRGVSRDYVVSMGERAYIGAGRTAPWAGAAPGAAMAQAFLELAETFDVFARALDDVREVTSLKTPQDIVRLYDRWRRTRSPVLAERLRQAGVYPQRPGDEELH